MPMWRWCRPASRFVALWSFLSLVFIAPAHSEPFSPDPKGHVSGERYIPENSKMVAWEGSFIPPQPTMRSALPYFAHVHSRHHQMAVSEEVIEFPIHQYGSSRAQSHELEEEGIPLLSETVVEGRFIKPTAGGPEKPVGVDLIAEAVVENGAVERMVDDQLTEPIPAGEVVEDGPFIDPFEDAVQKEGTEESRDPWESFNSSMFDFNYNLDRYVMKPVAKGYNFFIPPDVQNSLGNAFTNMAFAPRFLNNVFQGKFRRAGTETQRFLINTIIGVGGLFDVAKYVFEIEAPATEDVGQTLAVGGVGSGPYLILPFLPPTTVRDLVGFVGDTFLNPLNYFIPLIPNLGINGGKRINERSITLETFEGIEDSTIDLYGAVRSAYFDRRARQIRE